jgi:hypothetical protein
VARSHLNLRNSLIIRVTNRICTYPPSASGQQIDLPSKWEYQNMKSWVKSIFAIALWVCPITAVGQNFTSGSTGADGPLDLSAGDRVVQLPESGILNYTTVNIPPGRSLTFARNYRNTPVIMLVQGAVNIAGFIELSGASGLAGSGRGIPGPGGFYGGFPAGFGPGGGQPSVANPSINDCTPAKWVGSLSLVPIIGGSGAGCIGTGGGGAMVIASSSSIILSGQITANGGRDTNVGNGSGGAIRLAANTITITGRIDAKGDFSTPGIIRVEAPAGQLFYSGTGVPAPILSTTINPVILPDNSTPSLAIVSIGGFPVSYAAGRPDVVDLMLPNQLADPVNILIQGHNIPVGTQVNLNLSGPTQGTFTPGTLSGSQLSSSVTIAVSGLSRMGTTYILAFADFTLPNSIAGLNRTGPNQIAKVRVIAKPNTNSKIVFMRKDGTEIDLPNVPKTIQQQFGLN